MKNPRCSQCGSEKTQKRGMREGKIRYQCRGCGNWFQVNRGRKPEKKRMLQEHLDGSSFRVLAERYQVSVGTAYNWCFEELGKLPHCGDITRKYCSRFCGFVEVDGKFVKVKGYERKIPVIYAIDYLSHDIPTYLLSESESYQACKKLFTSLRLMNYPLAGLTSDDNRNIYEACEEVYPGVISQLCQNHYKENVRQILGVRREECPEKHVIFMRTLEKLMAKKRSGKELEVIAGKMVKVFGHDSLLLTILADMQQRKNQLFAYQQLKGIPTTTNLIESYNSHLQGRLETIKGFENFHHANLWLNGYFLRRRTKKFTDCTRKFKYLNGRTSLSRTLNRGIDTPTFFD
jgi:hypothetical protein